MKPKHILLKNDKVIEMFLIKKSNEQIKQKQELSDEEFVAILLGAKPVEGSE